MYTRKEQIASGKPVKPLTEDERLVKIQYDNGGGGDFPDPASVPDGKVLTTDSGAAVWGDAPSGLPDITAEDEGKVLTVAENVEETKVVVAPVQTVAMLGGGATLADVDFSTLESEDVVTVSVTLDGETYTLDCPYEYGALTTNGGRDNVLTSDGHLYSFGGWSGLSGQATCEAYIMSEQPSGTYSAQWAEPSGGTMPDLSGLEVPLGAAVMGAISAIPSGGLMGKYASLQGSTITAEQAEAVANAINVGRFTALDMNISVVTGAITTPSSEHLHISLGSLAFVVPYYSDYIIGASIRTEESTTGETYLPAVFVSAWAIKIANYPTNG